MTTKRIEISEGVLAVDLGDTIRLVARPDALIRAAVAVLEARYDGGDWSKLNEAIGGLEDALRRAGYDGRLPGEGKPR